jgi:hypothetical protein
VGCARDDSDDQKNFPNSIVNGRWSVLFGARCKEKNTKKKLIFSWLPVINLFCGYSVAIKKSKKTVTVQSLICAIPNTPITVMPDLTSMPVNSGFPPSRE